MSAQLKVKGTANKQILTQNPGTVNKLKWTKQMDRANKQCVIPTMKIRAEMQAGCWQNQAQQTRLTSISLTRSNS